MIKPCGAEASRFPHGQQSQRWSGPQAAGLCPFLQGQLGVTTSGSDLEREGNHGSDTRPLLDHLFWVQMKAGLVPSGNGSRSSLRVSTADTPLG